MATLVELCESGALVIIDPLEPSELAWRKLYGTKEFVRWLDDVLPGLQHNKLYSRLTALEQVYAVFAECVSGEPFCVHWKFKKLNCKPDHYVWEFKTDDVRVFGWVPEKDAFVCCFGETKSELVRQDSYGKFIAKTVFERGNLPLDEPKYVSSGECGDVVSDAY